MKRPLEEKIFFGYIANLILIVILTVVFIIRINANILPALDNFLFWIELVLFTISAFLMTAVYIQTRTQLRIREISEALLAQNKDLLQSIIDNTTNPIFIKKINGEYLLINKQFELLYNVTIDMVMGKTDYEFLPKEKADAIRNSDFEVIKAQKELKSEEQIHQSDGPHTYIAVKFPLFDSQGKIYAIGGISTDITERKNLEGSLSTAAEFFNISLDLMVIATKDKFIKVNPAVSRILGYTENELLGKSFFDFIHPQDQDVTKQEISKLEMGLQTLHFENRWITKDGNLRWLEWTATPEAKTGMFFAVAREITAKKETEQSLAVAEKFFTMSADIMAVAKGDFFIKINPAFTRILGRTQTDMDNTPFLSFVHPDDLQTATDAINTLRKRDSVVNFRVRSKTKEGAYKLLDWTATIDLQTGIMFGVARDVTETVENEGSIKMADKFFNMAFDILTVVKNERFIKINPAFTKTLGYDQSDLDKIKFTELTHPDDKAITDDVLAKLRNGEPIVNFVDRIISKDGSYKWLNWHSNFDISQGTLYSVARDITDKVASEKEKEKATEVIHQNEEKLRLVIENISEGVIVANSSREIIIANDMANEILEADEDVKIPFNLSDQFELLQPDGKNAFPSQNLPMERALAGDEIDDVDIILVNRNNRNRKRVLISGRPLHDQQNKVIAAVITIKDITKYKQLETELKETETKYRQLIGFKKDEVKQQ